MRLQINCNEVDVLNIVLSDMVCSKSDWSTYWNRDIKKMRFLTSDTASDYYRTLESSGKDHCLKFLLILTILKMGSGPFNKGPINDVQHSCFFQAQ